MELLLDALQAPLSVLRTASDMNTSEAMRESRKTLPRELVRCAPCNMPEPFAYDAEHVENIPSP